MWSMSGDPARDFLKYDNEQQEELEKQPVCLWCGEHIQTEWAVQTDDGDYICANCIDDHRKWMF